MTDHDYAEWGTLGAEVRDRIAEVAVVSYVESYDDARSCHLHLTYGSTSENGQKVGLSVRVDTGTVADYQVSIEPIVLDARTERRVNFTYPQRPDAELAPFLAVPRARVYDQEVNFSTGSVAPEARGFFERISGIAFALVDLNRSAVSVD
jgi:hypothetical protein